MNIQAYIDSRKELLNYILQFIDCDENEINLQKLFDFMNQKIIPDDKVNLEVFLKLVSKISQNHHRKEGFFSKIEKIIDHFQDIIKQLFSIFEILDIFGKSKRLVLYLFQKNFLPHDDELIIGKIKQIGYNTHDYNYYDYFSPEIKPNSFKKCIEEYPNEYTDFDINRQKGENETMLAELIRKDSIEQFIIYINQNNFLPSSKLKLSKYETNNFLSSYREVSLIEYAAFFGSIRIFQYLQMNDANISPDLWLFAIHGRNGEIIDLLEANQIKPSDKTYNQCYSEAIKCYHNEVADYIKNNLLIQKVDKKDSNVFSTRTTKYALKYQNYFYFPNDFNNELTSYLIIKYDYVYFAKLLIKNDQLFFSTNPKYSLPFVAFKKANNMEFSIFLLKYYPFIDEQIFQNNLILTKISIPSSIKIICQSAFKECKNLEDVDFEKSNNLEIICNSAFYSTAIKRLYIDHSNLNTIEFDAFKNCTNLKEITITNSPLKVIQKNAFSSCKSLISVSLPPSVSEFGDGVFIFCSSLVEINLPHLNEISAYTFSQCKSLMQITIPSSCKSINSYAFSNCSELKKVTFEEPSSLLSICELAFFGCKSLNELEIPQTVVDIHKKAFKQCKSLTNLKVHSPFNEKGYFEF